MPKSSPSFFCSLPCGITAGITQLLANSCCEVSRALGKLLIVVWIEMELIYIEKPIIN